MTWFVIRNTDNNKIVLYGEQIRDPIAGRNEELLGPFTGDVPATARRGATIADDGTITPETAVAVDLIAQIRAETREYARRILINLDPVWLFDATGSPRNLLDGSNPTLVSRRWSNVYYWALSPLLVIEGILNRNSATWTPEVALNAFAAYQSLVPDSRQDFDFWYRNHTEAVWTAYRNEVSNGRSRVYFGWNRTGDIPVFASDANSAQSWNGTGGTFSARIPVSASTVEEALVT